MPQTHNFSSPSSVGAPPLRFEEKLDLTALPLESIHRFHIGLTGTPLGTPIFVPVVVIRGKYNGPVVGVTSTIHGNELNGIPVIHRLLPTIDPAQLRGTVVAVPVVNTPGYLNQQRRFNDGVDLNRIMPGNPKGTSAQVYAHRFLDRIVKNFNYLIDLHTASFGRINSFYVRADLNCKTTDWMARLQHASIILHNSGPDGALRSAAADMGIHAITLELGDPMLFQKHLFIPGLSGILNVLSRLEMLPQQEIPPITPPLVCRRSYWIYTTTGGLLDVLPPLGKIISKGERVAKVMNIFGDTLEEYFAPEDGVVIGRSTNPVNQTGSRILHLGVIGE